jgi:hypothetical protein
MVVARSLFPLDELNSTGSPDENSCVDHATEIIDREQNRKRLRSLHVCAPQVQYRSIAIITAAAANSGKRWHPSAVAIRRIANSPVAGFELIDQNKLRAAELNRWRTLICVARSLSRDYPLWSVEFSSGGWWQRLFPSQAVAGKRNRDGFHYMVRSGLTECQSPRAQSRYCRQVGTRVPRRQRRLLADSMFSPERQVRSLALIVS